MLWLAVMTHANEARAGWPHLVAEYSLSRSVPSCGRIDSAGDGGIEGWGVAVKCSPYEGEAQRNQVG